MSEELQAEKKETKYLKSVISTLEEKVSELQSTEQDNLRLKSAIESLSVVNGNNLNCLRGYGIFLALKISIFYEVFKTRNKVEICVIFHKKTINLFHFNFN